MKKSLIITFAFLMMLSAMAMATDTRVMTMGDNNNVLLDDANVWLYPSRINEYPNLAIGEIDGGGDFYNMGVHWKFGDNNPFVIGTYFTDDFTFNPGIPSFSPQPNRRIDLIYGRELGGNNFGFGLSYIHSSEDFEAVGDSANEAMSIYGLTFGLTEASGLWDLSVMAEFGSWTNENSGGFIENDADGFNSFGVKGRYFKQNGPNYTYIPHAEIMVSKFGYNIYDGTSSQNLVNNQKYSTFGLDLGIGLNYTPANNVLAVFDVGVMLLNEKYEFTPSGGTTDEDKYNTFTLPYFKLGFDADVFKWLDIRAGVTSYWHNEKYEYTSGSTTDTYKYKYADNETYLGFGFHFGRLHIDTEANPELFQEGFNFISNGSEDMNWRISFAYEMM